MNRNSLVAEILERYESLKSKQGTASPEELCRDCPELIDEVRRGISALDSINRLLDSDTTKMPAEDRPGERAETGQDPAADLPQQLGRFRPESRIGKGGFGEVWRAYDPQLERYVAIKIANNHAGSKQRRIDAVMQEARKVAKLTHPGIVTVHDVGQQGNRCFIVSQLIDGGSLADRLRQGPLPLATSVQIVAEVAEALHYAHLHDIVHRDVKPGNILVDKQNKAYLTDFGIAVTEDELLDGKDSIAGTPAYMSPEQIQGEKTQINCQSDIYSLGVVFYELLTGRLPFRAKTLTDLRKQILQGEPRPPRSIDDAIPSRFERICRKAMARKPADRYTTAIDFACDLRSTPILRALRMFGMITLCLMPLALLCGLLIAWPRMFRTPAITKEPPRSAFSGQQGVTASNVGTRYVVAPRSTKPAPTPGNGVESRTREALWIGRKDGKLHQSISPANEPIVGCQICTRGYNAHYATRRVEWIRPLFLTQDGKIREGPMLGTEGSKYGIKPKVSQVLAKEGYALGGIEATAGIWGSDPTAGYTTKLRFVFMKRTGSRLDPSQRYESLWYGENESKTFVASISDGALVVGIKCYVDRFFKGVAVVLPRDDGQ